MENTEHYIGIPCGIVICVEQKSSKDMQGKFYHAYSRQAIAFDSAEQLILQMDRFFNQLRYPFPATKERVFQKYETRGIKNMAKMKKVVDDKKLLEQHGDAGTFIVRVRYRQNSSWQGDVTWVEENKTLNFRSALELLKMIDSAIGDDVDIASFMDGRGA